MRWLVTGGAGYIGGHVTRALTAAGHGVVVLDDLSTGRAERVAPGVPLVEASVQQTARLREILRCQRIDGVVHLAAKKAVGESIQRPLDYYCENLHGFEHLLRAMVEEGIERIVFSSSAAIYGWPDVDMVREDTPAHPLSPYGETKLACEWLLRSVGAAHGMHWVALRYFNVAGAGWPELGDTAVGNLIPMVFRALDEGRPPEIFGDDYPTPDGTCVRDYVHVADLADTHVLAADRLANHHAAAVYNVGCGRGWSVREVIDTVREVTRIDVPPVVTARRPGDPARLVANADALARDFQWTASRDLTDIVASAWDAWTSPGPPSTS